MKKHRLFPAFILGIGPLAALAQTPITLTQSNFPAAVGTVERYQDANLPAGMTATPTGASQTWDYRTLTAAGAPYTIAYLPVPSGSPFATAQWARARTAALGSFSYNFTSYYQLNSTGRLGLGRTILRQATSLGLLTGNSTDSVVVSRQTIPFTTASGTPYRDIPLPLTAGSREIGNLRFGTTGILTVAALGLTRAPFRIVQRIVQVDSVAGWGTARVPVAGSSTGSAPLAVLQVRERIVQQDSMYLNGAPAPALLLAALGLTQGQTRTYFTDLFFRSGSAQPVLDLYYNSRLFGTPNAADYSTESTLLASRLSAAAAGLAIVPNPGSTATATVLMALDGRHEALRLTVRDVLGRVVASAPARTNEPIPVLDGLPAGTYLLEILSNAGAASILRLVRE
ncbi:T9SS type A sorting domain-containing protein [Hymenobacter daeguensis]